MLTLLQSGIAQDAWPGVLFEKEDSSSSDTSVMTAKIRTEADMGTPNIPGCKVQGRVLRAIEKGEKRKAEWESSTGREQHQDDNNQSHGSGSWGEWDPWKQYSHSYDKKERESGYGHRDKTNRAGSSSRDNNKWQDSKSWQTGSRSSWKGSSNTKPQQGWKSGGW